MFRILLVKVAEFPNFAGYAGSFDSNTFQSGPDLADIKNPQIRATEETCRL